MTLTQHPSLVSIGVPVYNGDATLRATLDGLLAQDYSNIEIMISDNASTDATAAICEEYVRRDSRATYHRSSINRGAIWNFNQVYKLSSGKYFMWAAADDARESSYVRHCVQCLEENSTAVLCYPTAWLVRPTTRTLCFTDLDVRDSDPVQRFRSLMLTRCEWATAVYGLIRADALQRTSLFENYLKSDYGLLFQLALLGTFVHCTSALFYYTVRLPDDSYEAYYRRMSRSLHPSNRVRIIRLPSIEFGVRLISMIRRKPLPPRIKRAIYKLIIRHLFVTPRTIVEFWRACKVALGLRHLKSLLNLKRP